MPSEFLFQTIIIYSLLILVLIFFAKKEARLSCGQNISVTKTSSFFTKNIWIIILIFTCVSGIRYDVGTDYCSYLRDYMDGTEAYHSVHELLFQKITLFCYEANFHPTVYFALWAFIQITLFLYAFREYKVIYPYLILFIFVNLTFFSWMNGIRQDIAACIWIFALQYILKKKFLKYLAACVIAMMFHRSAVLLIPLYFLFVKEQNRLSSIPVQIVVFVLANVFRIVFSSFIKEIDILMLFFGDALSNGSDVYAHYDMAETLEQIQNYQSGTNLGLIGKGAVYILIIFYSQKLKHYYNSRYFNLLYSLFFIGVCTIYMIPSGAINIERPFRYFSFFTTVMLAFFVNYLLKNKQNKNNRIIAYGVCTLFILLFTANAIVTISNDLPHVAYKLYYQIPVSRLGEF